VKEFLEVLSDGDAAAIVAAMKEVAIDGLRAARHVRGNIYEVRADGIAPPIGCSSRPRVRMSRSSWRASRRRRRGLLQRSSASPNDG